LNQTKIIMWKTIKNLLSKGGGKCIIVENEKPVFVVMSFGEYENLLEKGGEPSESAEIEKVNRDISEWQSGGEDNNLEEINPKEEFKVEDLPF